jgi:hypothetical protein
MELLQPRSTFTRRQIVYEGTDYMLVMKFTAR